MSPIPRRVFVVGAGASYGRAGKGPPFPLTATLLADILRHRREQNLPILDVVLRVIAMYTGSTSISVNLESLLTWLELERDRLANISFTSQDRECLRDDIAQCFQNLCGPESRPPMPSHDRPIYRLWCDLTILLLKQYLADFIRDLSTDSDCPAHRILVESLTDRDALLTFNYDRLLDHALSDRCGFPVTAVPSQMHGHTEILRQEGLLPPSGPKWEFHNFLKLHGSAGWTVWRSLDRRGRFSRPWIPSRSDQLRYSRGPHMLLDSWSTPADPLARFVAEENIWMFLEPCIIPPVLSKELYLRRGSLFHELWELAFGLLAAATEVVVIGYSLPGSDFRAAWLFRSACLSSANPPLVRIVNPDGKDLARRFRNDALFPRAKIEVDSASTLQEFVTGLSGP